MKNADGFVVETLKYGFPSFNCRANKEASAALKSPCNRALIANIFESVGRYLQVLPRIKIAMGV